MEKLAHLLMEKSKKLGFSYQELAEKVGVSAVYISQILRGKRIPRDAILFKLCKILELDPDLILALARYEKAPSEEVRQYLKSKIQGSGLRSMTKTYDNVEPWDLGVGRRIPVLGWVQAGKFAPSESEDLGPLTTDEYVYSDIKGKNLFALKVENDSMEPIFHPGDIIIINPNLKPKTGDYVIVRVQGEVTFKKLIIKDKLVVLKPLNPKYEDIFLRPKDEFEIIGKVVEKKTFF